MSITKPVRRAATKVKRAMGQYKSAGVKVSAALHRLIGEGNAARAAKDWPRAAKLYRDVVKSAPELTHIWVQLGHALKESGAYDEAAEAYGQAEALGGDDGAGAVQLGNVAKLQGRGADAIQHYLRAYRTSRDPEALRELLVLVDQNDGVPRESIMRALERTGSPRKATPTRAEDRSKLALNSVLEKARELGLDHAQLQALESVQKLIAEQTLAAAEAEAFDISSVPALVFDASDLISYFGNARLPTGIQRVQIATITGAFSKRPAGSVRICCFSDRSDSWSEVPPDLFLEICALAVVSGDRKDPEWTDAYTEMRLALSFSPPFEFPDGAFLVNLGTSWWLQNYFMFVREAKRTHNIRYVPFVHDLIPIMTPEHCVRELTQDFISWALGAFQHADFFLVNSEATKRDLIKVADVLGQEVDSDAVAVIPLNARFGSPDAKTAPLERLRTWQLTPEKFVLIVSTIESRKNHIGALDAWLELIRKHGARNVPKLVCVGNRGWLNDAVYARIDHSPALRERVVMLSGLSDEELALLYRTCRFTLYPSNYEGWGLPVTESLCYGKVPVVSNVSSLPEAGGDFAVYFEAGSTTDLTAQLERLMLDNGELKRLEDKIRKDFRPREWDDVADQIADVLEAFGRRSEEVEASAFEAELVKPGCYYPITRNAELRIWRGLASAEVFRTGTGWWWPDDWGCWIKPSGGELSLRFPPGKGAVRGFVRLHAPPDGDCKFTISIEEAGFFLDGVLTAGEFRWVPCDIPEDAAAEAVQIRLRGSVAIDLSERTSGLDLRVISLGVAGFYFCRADDYEARANFVEALATDSLRTLAFNREPMPGRSFATGAPGLAVPGYAAGDGKGQGPGLEVELIRV